MRDAAAAMAACSGPARASVTASGPGLGGAHRCAAQAAPAPGARMTLKSDVRWGPDPSSRKVGAPSTLALESGLGMAVVT